MLTGSFAKGVQERYRQLKPDIRLKLAFPHISHKDLLVCLWQRAQSLTASTDGGFDEAASRKALCGQYGDVITELNNTAELN